MDYYELGARCKKAMSKVQLGDKDVTEKGVLRQHLLDTGFTVEEVEAIKECKSVHPQHDTFFAGYCGVPVEEFKERDAAVKYRAN